MLKVIFKNGKGFIWNYKRFARNILYLLLIIAYFVAYCVVSHMDYTAVIEHIN